MSALDKTGLSCSRRTFLQQTAVVGAAVFPAIIPASALGADGHTAPSDRIVMGCIGLGGKGSGNMAEFANHPDVQIVALCDVDAAHLQRAKDYLDSQYASRASNGRATGCDIYGDFRQLLARGDLDAVSIATPDHWHAITAVESARAGLDIYCEKPLANSIAEGRAIVNAVRNYGRILQTGSHERSGRNARFACELVRSGRIGKLHTMRVNLPVGQKHHLQVLQRDKPVPPMPVPDGFDYDMWLGPAPWAPYHSTRCHFMWRFILDYGGGEMTDRGAHVLDLAQLGNDTDDTGPVEIKATGQRPSSGIYDTFMSYEFECVYKNGVRLVGQSSGQRGVKFEGTDGWIFIHIHGANLEADPPSLLHETLGASDVHLGRSPGHHRNFLDSVKTRIDPVAPAETGHRTASLCHLINIAMLMERPLHWDPVTEQITNDAAANRLVTHAMRSPWRV